MKQIKQFIIPTKKKLLGTLFGAIGSFSLLYLSFAMSFNGGGSWLFYISIPISFPSLLFIHEAVLDSEKVLQLRIMMVIAIMCLQYLYSYLLASIFNGLYRKFIQ